MVFHVAAAMAAAWLALWMWAGSDGPRRSGVQSLAVKAVVDCCGASVSDRTATLTMDTSQETDDPGGASKNDDRDIWSAAGISAKSPYFFYWNGGRYEKDESRVDTTPTARRLSPVEGVSGSNSISSCGMPREFAMPQSFVSSLSSNSPPPTLSALSSVATSPAATTDPWPTVGVTAADDLTGVHSCIEARHRSNGDSLTVDTRAEGAALGRTSVTAVGSLAAGTADRKLDVKDGLRRATDVNRHRGDSGLIGSVNQCSYGAGSVTYNARPPVIGGRRGVLAKSASAVAAAVGNHKVLLRTHSMGENVVYGTPMLSSTPPPRLERLGGSVETASTRISYGQFALRPSSTAPTTPSTPNISPSGGVRLSANNAVQQTGEEKTLSAAANAAGEAARDDRARLRGTAGVVRTTPGSGADGDCTARAGRVHSIRGCKSAEEQVGANWSGVKLGSERSQSFGPRRRASMGAGTRLSIEPRRPLPSGNERALCMGPGRTLSISYDGAATAVSSTSRTRSQASIISTVESDAKTSFPWRAMCRSSAAWAVVAGNVGNSTGVAVVMSWQPTYFKELLDANLEDMRLLDQASIRC